MKEINDKWFYIPILVLGVYFIFRLIDQSNILRFFPLDYTNDISSYMAILYFLVKCGYNQFCPYWYNGFITFIVHPPAWYFFALPFYLITKNVQYAIYITLIVIYLFMFIAFYFLGKIEKITLTKTIALSLFFLANSIAIGDFIRLMRVAALLAWLLFILLAIIVFYYKDRPLDKKFIFFIPVYALIILTHYQEAVLASVLLLSLFLVKNLKEKILMVVSGIISLALASFWLVPFLINLTKNVLIEYSEGRWLLIFTKQWLLTNIVASIIPIVFFVVFYLYWKSKDKSKQELLFYSPILMLAILFFLRLTPFIPILKDISPDPYLLFFIFFIGLLIIKTRFTINFRRLVILCLILFSLISVSISIIHTPRFIVPGELENETIGLLPSVEGRFLMFNFPPKTSYSQAYYSYAPIYYNISTSEGWSPQVKDKEYLDKSVNVRLAFENRNCKEFINLLEYLNTTSVLGYKEACDFYKDCNLIEKIKKENVCLYVK